MDVLIVDDDAEAVPAGSPGEIAVRSRYLALGYWNEPDLTDKRFLSDGEDGELRMYLTGDLGRFRDDGCLEYLGRRDGELKILGNRVEPAEVEAELIRLPGVKDAGVTTCEGRRGEGRPRIRRYRREPRAARERRRRALQQRLPSYMVPSTLSAITSFRSVQRQDRPPRSRESRRSHGLPRSCHRERAARRTDLGGRPRNTPDWRRRRFFALGGDSLAAAEIIACLEQTTGASPPASVLAGAPTVSRFAAALQSGQSYGASRLAILRDGVDRAPLILLHGNTGNTLHYVTSCLGLMAIGQCGGSNTWQRRRQRGRDRGESRHVSQKATPVGPFLIVGFCFGAVIAHEIACQLRASGDEVSLLVLLRITPLGFRQW